MNYELRTSITNRQSRVMTVLGSVERGMLLPATLRDHDHPNVFRLSDDSQDQVRANQTIPPMIFGARDEDLSDLMAMRKMNNRLRWVATFDHGCFDVQVFREVQMLFDTFDVPVGLPILLGWTQNADREAIGAEIIGHAAASPDEHGARWVRRNINQYPV